MNRLPELSTAFINHCRYAKNLSENSLRAYQQDLDDFCRYAEIAKFEKTIEGSHIENLLVFLMKKNRLIQELLNEKLPVCHLFLTGRKKAAHLRLTL